MNPRNAESHPLVTGGSANFILPTTQIVHKLPMNCQRKSSKKAEKSALSSDSGDPLWTQALLALPATDFQVWSYLRWRQGRNRTAYPAQETMARELGMTENGVRKITRRLADKDWLVIIPPAKRGKGHHLHYVTKHPTEGYTGVYPLDSKGSTAVEGLQAQRVNGCARKGSTAHRTNTLHRTLHSSTCFSEEATSGFTPPTVDEVREYAASKGHSEFDADYFVQWYTEAGWVKTTGKPVTNWKLTVLNWLKPMRDRCGTSGESSGDGYSQFGSHPASGDEIQRLQKEGLLS